MSDDFLTHISLLKVNILDRSLDVKANKKTIQSSNDDFAVL